LQEWRNRVAAEYRSAARTSDLLHQLITAGLPRPILATAGRIVQDELDHADGCHAVVEALGGGDAPATLELSALIIAPSGDGLLADILDTVLHDFCLGETLAVPLFRAMWHEATHPAAREALTRILRDEATHRAFGWTALDALIELDPSGTRARAQALLPAWICAFRDAYADGREAPTLRAEERAAGLIDLDDYARIFETALNSDIRRRFAARGITV
jgi:hypothetical protein